MDDFGAFIERVKSASDIVEVVGERLTLRPKGREFTGLCPFHPDHNPSMNVVPSKQIYHCFVCGAGGSVFTFIQKFHGVEFIDALRLLAERAGLEMPARRRPDGHADAAPTASRQDVVDANRLALGFFRAILAHPEHGGLARGIVTKRGISAAMVERFGLGAAPDKWDGLKLMAERAGWPIDRLLAAGLLKKAQDTGRVYDALRNRLIFPILGESGEPIAFGARRIDDKDEPKYLNSPDTAAFKKAGTLFGLSLARNAIRAEATTVVVEGYTDVIACHQAGLEHVVGTLGTAFTAEHAKRLRGLCPRVVLLFDGDAAGQLAADRAFEVLLSARMDVAVATLAGVTDAKDPDELLKREGGATVLRRALAGAVHIADYWGRRLAAALRDAEPAQKARRLAEELARLAELGVNAVSPVERRVLLERLAVSAGLPLEEVIRSLPGGRRPATAGAAGSAGESPARALATARLSDDAYLIGCALADQELVEDLRGLGLPQPADPAIAAVLAGLLAGGGRTPVFADAEVAETAAALEHRVRALTDGEAMATRDLFAEIVRRVRGDRLTEAASRGDVASRIALLKERDALGGAATVVNPWGRRKPRG